MYFSRGLPVSKHTHTHIFQLIGLFLCFPDYFRKSFQSRRGRSAKVEIDLEKISKQKWSRICCLVERRAAILIRQNKNWQTSVLRNKLHIVKTNFISSQQISENSNVKRTKPSQKTKQLESKWMLPEVNVWNSLKRKVCLKFLKYFWKKTWLVDVFWCHFFISQHLLWLTAANLLKS